MGHSGCCRQENNEKKIANEERKNRAGRAASQIAMKNLEGKNEEIESSLHPEIIMNITPDSERKQRKNTGRLG